MKKLLLLRGAPASGKSTFIKDNNLEPYVISSDNLRIMVAGLSMDLDGNMKTSQDLDRKVWGFLGEILDERMRYGATTMIDATHNSTKSFKKYKPLAEKYDYKVYCITFTEPIPELMRRNAARPAYKVVPPDCIYAMAHKVESQPTPDWVKDITSIDEFFNDPTPDLTDKYDTIKVIGDVHGCFNSLTDAILPLDPQTLYVFCGDYLDRGVQNKEMLNWVIEHRHDHTLEGMVLVDDRGYMCKEKFLYYVKVKQLRGFLQSCVKTHLNGQPLPKPRQEFMSDIVEKVLHSGHFSDEELENLHVIDAVKYYEAHFKKLSF